MALRIEDYAMVGDLHTAALIGRDGCIDWLCLPRFDSASTFGSLLGTEDHGHWRLAPQGTVLETSRAYIEDTFVLVTRWVTDDGEVEVVDFMPIGDRRADLVRRIRGIRGSVVMAQELRVRFDYANAIPWMRQIPDEHGPALVAVAGPDAVVVRGAEFTARDHSHRSELTVNEGDVVDMTLTWFPAHRDIPKPLDVQRRLRYTKKWWRDWASMSTASPVYREQVHRSLLVLRALTHEDTGGIVAAATTSLPEQFGGERNWDYRYVWLRDASLTLGVLMEHGYAAEADAWRRWLLRAVAGDPADIQIMYGLSGERRLTEREIDSLPGYHGAAPVRVGNDAWRQYQGDIFGEVMFALRGARDRGIKETESSWPLQRALMSFVEKNWRKPDNGLWEIRGQKRHFTHSQVMIWTAFDCAINGVREYGLDGPVELWERMRDEVRDDIESRGFDVAKNSYTQFFGGSAVDASLLLLPQVGYIDSNDPRMLGTVAAIEAELMEGGLLKRYLTESGVDGLPSGEHPFLACSFWLVEQYARSGRLEDARQLMDRLVAFTNDVGLLSEEYAVSVGRQAGNTPQAYSHLSLVRAADAIAAAMAREKSL
ncbi:glycoside hydrolase family 15 protein [Lacisediminihabitans changchengi]|uniref:Glycoside hydrolase family 15 protein n=1 Tax=Lacisediminihabitans changchengi TaxID=2787634 RepID=A0A934SPF3_9MICO|nr:glycoside hydrolase family 15 protein [Lacisediminihabitans changchengi]MBK4346565.1 glycoside hydrolase family 15 protein [Lacisediminihabitans changchengi]